MYPSGRVRCLNKVSTSISTTQVKMRRRADHGCTCWWDQGTRPQHPGNHSARGTRFGGKRSYSAGGINAFSASRASLVMLTNPSESLDASPKRSTFEIRCFAGGADPLESEGDPDLGRGESTGIGAGIDPAKDGILLDDSRRRNEERDPDKATRLSSSEDSNDSVSESGGTLERSFWACLLPVWEADRFLLAVP